MSQKVERQFWKSRVSRVRLDTFWHFISICYSNLGSGTVRNNATSSRSSALLLLVVYHTFVVIHASYYDVCTLFHISFVKLSSHQKPVLFRQLVLVVRSDDKSDIKIVKLQCFTFSFISKSLRHHIKIWGRISKSLCSRSNMLFFFVSSFVFL